MFTPEARHSGIDIELLRPVPGRRPSLEATAVYGKN
jgi:hypothetical protein